MIICGFFLRSHIISITATGRRELVNTITHSIGIPASIAGLIMLLLRAGRLRDPWMFLGFSLYGASSILLFISSTLYHAITAGKVKSFFRFIDHGSIYLLIAGTYTPFALISLSGSWGWSLFGTIWGLALTGILFSSFAGGRFPKFATGTYVLMGWFSLIALPGLLNNMSLAGVVLLIIGGLVYSAGIIFYAWKALPYNHAIWHLFVLGGGVCHYFTVYYFVVPK